MFRAWCAKPPFSSFCLLYSVFFFSSTLDTLAHFRHSRHFFLLFALCSLLYALRYFPLTSVFDIPSSTLIREE